MSRLRVALCLGVLELVTGEVACGGRSTLGGMGGGSGGSGGVAGRVGTDGGIDMVPVDARPMDGRVIMATATFPDPPNRDVDMLFMVDNSNSMAPLQTKLAQQLPAFMNVLKGLRGGQPNLHVAVISSSLGAGQYPMVPGCARPTGDQEGFFQHALSCTGLPADQTYLSSTSVPSTGPRAYVNNFTGDIADLFSCIALLGQSGCGF